MEERDEEVMQKIKIKKISNNKKMMMMKNTRQDVLEFLSLVACKNDNNTESRGRASSCGKKCCFYFRPFEMEMSRPYVQREAALLKMRDWNSGEPSKLARKMGQQHFLH